jgi:hypothetical protein
MRDYPNYGFGSVRLRALTDLRSLRCRLRLTVLLVTAAAMADIMVLPMVATALTEPTDKPSLRIWGLWV